MKLKTLIICSTLLFTNIAFAGPDHGEHKPMKGGVLATVKDVDYELVANASSISLYVRDHGKSVDLSKASAKITLLTGSDKQEVDLQPTAEKLESKGNFKVSAGTKVVAIINLQGKSATTARFVLK
jgi:hypothetical protein